MVEREACEGQAGPCRKLDAVDNETQSIGATPANAPLDVAVGLAASLAEVSKPVEKSGRRDDRLAGKARRR